MNIQPHWCAAILFHSNNGGQGRYRFEKVLQPGQQIWLDVGQLIHNQVPDSDGNTLPPDTMVGSYELRDLDHAAVGLLYEGKLIIDKTYGHASYGCGTCCGYLKAQVWINPFSGPPSINNNDFYQAEEQCGGYWDDFTSIATNWQSSNTAVTTPPNRTLHTVAPGTATGSAEAYLQASKPAPSCPNGWFEGQQPETVKQVYQVEPLATAAQGQDGTNGLPSCATLGGPLGSRGWVRNLTNQVQYSDGTSVNFSGITVGDTLTIATPNGLNVSGTKTGTFQTTGDGSFPDTYYVRSTACFGSSERPAVRKPGAGSSRLLAPSLTNETRFAAGSATCESVGAEAQKSSA